MLKFKGDAGAVVAMALDGAIDSDKEEALLFTPLRGRSRPHGSKGKRRDVIY